MGTTQERILKILKENESGLSAFEVADEMDYKARTRMPCHLQRLKNFGLVEFRIVRDKKLWFFVG